jgi:hypothetical protein
MERKKLFADFVRNREFFAAFGTAGSQHLTPVGRGHSFAETVFVAAFALRGLERSFHLLLSLFLITICCEPHRKANRYEPRILSPTRFSVCFRLKNKTAAECKYTTFSDNQKFYGRIVPHGIPEIQLHSDK